MKKKLFSMALLYTLFLSSCNKENSIVEQIKTGETDLSVPTDSRVIESENNSRTSAPEGQETSEDVLMRKFAISLAKSLNNKSVRSFLKIEAGKQFDGDYDILFSNNKTAVLEEKTFQDVLLTSGDLKLSDLEELIKVNPKLNISIPINIEKWNSTNQAPVVAYLSSGYEENGTKTLLGYDYNGKQYGIDAIEEPSVPVIVIGMNERVDDDDNVRKGFLQNFGETVLSKTNNAKITACTAPYRTNGTDERMYQVRMNVGAYEGWAKGKAELMFKCFCPNAASPSSFASNIYESDEINVYRNQSNNWVTREFYMFYWDNSIFTQSMMFYFYEYDGKGKSVEISVGDTYKLNDNNTISATAKFNLQKSDKLIGRVVINQFACPPYSDSDKSYYQINTNFAFATKSFN